MKRRLAILVMCACLLALVFPGVGQAKQKVRYFYPIAPVEELALYRDLAKDFNAANPDVEVEIMDSAASGDYVQQLVVMSAAGTSPDVTFLACWSIPGLTEILEPLDAYIARDKYDMSQFFPVTVELGRASGKQFGMPRHPSPAVLFYNRSMFDTAGLAYPNDTTTWFTLRDSAKKLTKTDGANNTTQWGMRAPTSAPWDLFPVVRSFGGEVLNEAKGLFSLAEPQGVYPVQWLADLINVDHVAPLQSVAFSSGKIGVTIGLHHEVLVNNNQIGNSFDWDIAIYPQGPAGRTNRAVAGEYSILKGSSSKEGAWKFIKFLMLPETQLRIAESGLVMPSTIKAATSSKYRNPTSVKQSRQAFIDSLTKSDLRFEPFVPYFWEMVDVLNKALGPVWQGKSDARTALASVKTPVETMMKPKK